MAKAQSRFRFRQDPVFFRILFFCLILFGQKSQANVVGADTQNFNPITNGLDFVTVHSSETLKPGILNFGFFINYAVNSLPNYENSSTQSRTNFRDSLTSTDLNVGYGLMDNWDVGLSLPYLLSQSVDTDLSTFRGEYAQTGLTEIRMNTKYRFFGDDSRGAAAILSLNLNQIENNPFAGVDPGPTINIEGAVDTTVGRYAVGGNLGFRFRNAGTPVPELQGFVEPMGNQLIASAAVSYLLENYDLKLIGELFGAIPMEQSEFASDREQSSLELLSGVKWDLNQAIAMHAGAGTEVIHGTSSPDWRIYAGLNWVFGHGYPEEEELAIVRLDENRQEQVGDPFAGEPQAVEAFVARDILFDFNSDQIDENFSDSIRRMADYLKQPPGFSKLIITGHTDSVGSDLYNLKLSRRRAQSVRRSLASFGISAGKIVAAGDGERNPIADNGNFQGRSLNRRVEFQLIR